MYFSFLLTIVGLVPDSVGSNSGVADLTTATPDSFWVVNAEVLISPQVLCCPNWFCPKTVLFDAVENGILGKRIPNELRGLEKGDFGPSGVFGQFQFG